MLDLYRRRRIDAHIDMTPMIDTLLQLFLIFMLSASFAVSAVRLKLPRASASPDKPTREIVVSVGPDGGLNLQGHPVARAELDTKLRELMDSLGQHGVQLQAHRTLSYETVLRTMVEIKGAGADQVLLVYNPEDLK